MDYCPCGGEIESWEAVCKTCWRALKKYDAKFGSQLRQAVVKRFKASGRRDVLNQEMIKAIKNRIVSRRTRRIEHLKAKMKIYCKECEEKTGKKDIDDCFSCSFHVLVNQMFKEILNNEH